MKTLISRMFGRREKDVADEIQTPSIDPEAVYQSLMNGLNRMEAEEVDRVILTLYEAEPRPNPNAGEWIPLGEGSQYYPFEVLEESEQEMILNGKTYVVDSLVRNDVGGFVKHKDRRIERYHRTHRIPAFLSRLMPESNLNYSTEGGMIAAGEEGLRAFSENVAKEGWGPEAIERVVDAGIQEYHIVTRRLMENAGVLNALERMEREPSF